MSSQLHNKTSVAVGARKRQAKSTSAQIDFMVDYLVQNPHVATGKFNTLHGKADLTASWEKLADELNKMWNDGRTKDVKSWKSTWRDNKTLVSQKVAKIRLNQIATGNIGGPPLQLTEREQKILGLMGHDYVQGVDSLDAFPEEQLNAMELLAEGDESFLDNLPTTLTVQSTSDMSGSAHCTNYEMLDEIVEATYETDAPVIAPRLSKRQRTATAATEAEAAGPSRCTIVNQAPCAPTVSMPGQSCSRPNSLGRAQRTATATKRCRRTLGTQLEDARVDFAELADRQIACMEMFATTMQQMAANDRERNAILRTMAKNDEVRNEAFLGLAAALKDCVDVLKKK